ncbi:PR-1-like protein [Lophiostoma macrostomum CBS 122681]|uniref:PR-1-like protein n=1 Tax=Lophiostoma macrostomum CBS 122681 TaxID=1314788 RepID=A0A6A6SY02_9PLEO|nr:PR-1-like protein [Lophiostoma macrostomum CBS 122681]
MRSSLIIASALAVGAIAGPIRQRAIVTEVDLDVVTVTVYVTEGQDVPTAAPETTHSRHHTESKSSQVPSSSSAAPSYSVPETSTVVVAPSSTPVDTPSSTSTPLPESTTQAASSSAIVTSQAPTTTSAVYNGDHPTGTIQDTLSTGADYQAAVLYHHNAARANHNADPLTWCDDCETNARITAERCTFEHYIPDGANQGQNLFTVSGDSFNVTAGITESWYKGEFEPMLPYFGQADVPDSVFEQVGHLTQVLWKETTSVGCVSVDCSGKMTVGGQSSDMDKYTVCNYAPAGNYAGEYGKQVGEPISTTNLGSWSD